MRKITHIAMAVVEQKKRKVCGAPGCQEEASAGAKLKLTCLESPTLYPLAVERQLAVCKTHRQCVGFIGLSPDYTQASPLTTACKSTAKIFYLGRSFCEGCHNVYLEALLAQAKPRLTTVEIEAVRVKVVQDNYVPPPANHAEIAKLMAQVHALKGEAPKPKKAPGKKAAAGTAASAASPPPKATGKVVAGAGAKKSQVEPAPVKDVEEEQGASADEESSETDQMPDVLVTAAKDKDKFVEVEESTPAPTKETKALTAVAAAAGTPMPTPTTALSSAAAKQPAPKGKKTTPPVAKA